MKNTINNIVRVAIFLTLSNSFAQTFDEVYQKSLDILSQKVTYEVDTEYKLYKGIDGNKVVEEYSGYFAKNGTDVYQKLGAMELLQTNAYIVKLNSDDKEILVAKNTSSSAEPTTIDITTILDHFVKEKMEDKGSYYELEFNGKEGNQLKIAKLIMQLDKESGLIKKQTIYFSYITDFGVYDSNSLKHDYDAARLEIYFSNLKEISNKSNLQQERYFSIANNKIKLGAEFENFELFPVK